MATSIDEFLKHYDKIAVKMLGQDSIQKKMLESLQQSFVKFQLTNEQIGEIIGQIAIQTAATYNKDAIAAVDLIIKAMEDAKLKESQIKVNNRKIQGYDDNMLLNIVEHQASITSFAINANSKSAQETINTLKGKMQVVEKRVKPLTGTIACPPIALVVPPPQSLTVVVKSATEVDLTWDSVLNASLYVLYRDGVLIATTAAVEFHDINLVTKEKYVYAVRASIGGVESDYSTAFAIATS